MTVERTPVAKIYTEEQRQALTGFAALLPHLDETGLTRFQEEMIQEEHTRIFQECVKLNLISEICHLRDNYNKQKEIQ